MKDQEKDDRLQVEAQENNVPRDAQMPPDNVRETPDTDVSQETDAPGDESGISQEKPGSHGVFSFLNVLTVLTVVAVVAALGSLCFWFLRQPSLNAASNTEIPAAQDGDGSGGMVFVSGGEEEVQPPVIPDMSRETQEEAQTQEEPEERDVRDAAAFFGEESQGVAVSQIRVSGLTDAQRDAAGFRESDFVYALSSFLSGFGETAATAEFVGEARVSASGAYAWEVSLDGEEEPSITVLMYAAYPGNYLFIFNETDTARGSRLQSQAETQTQTETRNQTETRTQPQTQEGPASGYNAATLSVTGLPSVLANYLDNVYELQFSMYAYLYGQGRKVASAALTDYSIDADTRVAAMEFLLSDGSALTGTYRKNGNTYLFK